ncbi:MAG: bifunctional nuclease family protein [Olegusella sp.]|nr:bifunctional nuclease family protein [Olegusella sp.]MCI1933649.1 bifunctional nuclease family protein [Atopobiaceae bacterium]
MLVHMDIKTVVVAGGPVASLLVLATHNHGDKPAQELPIRIGTIEAAAISTGVVSEGGRRPKTHDLLLSTIRRLGAKLTGVAIVDVHGTTFYANLMLVDFKGTRIDIDCRPSDAIATAVRANVPIYADEHVLDTATLPDFAGVEQEEKKQELAEFHNFVENLNADDFGSRYDTHNRPSK